MLDYCKIHFHGTHPEKCEGDDLWKKRLFQNLKSIQKFREGILNHIILDEYSKYLLFV